MNDAKIKHLEFIQAIITRMYTNSFQLKGMAITIYSALLVLYAGKLFGNIVLFFATVPMFLFWLLDAYYLQQERKFRGIYNDVAELSSESERISVRLFEMPIQKYKGGKYCYCNVLWSQTMWPLYVLMIVLAVLGGIFL